MDDVLDNIVGWASEIFLLDSYSSDDTVTKALNRGVHVVQRRFRDFGDQWNFALSQLPVTAPWTMKLDPDERIDPQLKSAIEEAIQDSTVNGFTLERQLWFMRRPLPVRQRILRIWRTGTCTFSPVTVNEHPIVPGPISHLKGTIQHLDSPDLDHWMEKQNRYSTAEAIIAFKNLPLAVAPRLLGPALARRMWLKKHFRKLPLRYTALFLYHWLWQGAFRSGKSGYIWAKMRAEIVRLSEYKRLEMELTRSCPPQRIYSPGRPDARVHQAD